MYVPLVTFFFVILSLNAQSLQADLARTKASWDLTPALSEIVATFGLADTLGRRIREGSHKHVKMDKALRDSGLVYKS